MGGEGGKIIYDSKNDIVVGVPTLLIPYKFYVLGQIGLSKQCRPRSDCF